MDSTNKKNQNEKIIQIVKYILVTILFIGAVTAVIIGQKNIGPAGLGLMLVGLSILIFLLYMYNRKFK